MAFDRKEMARNLKLLATTPKEIERQQEVYRAKLAEINAEEKKGIWGKVTLDNRRKEAREERDRTCHALAKRMRPALEYVAANNAYGDTETVDFTSRKLQDALRTIEFMGKDLSYADQAAMLNSFRGDVGALRVLEKAYKKNGLYMHNAAHEMQKTISKQAIDEMAYVISAHDFYEAQGRFEWPIEKAYWTRGEFQKQLDRLGLEDTTTDPYAAVLEAATDKVRADRDAVDLEDLTDAEKAIEKAKYEAQIIKLNLAQLEMKEAQARGDNPATVLNRQLAKLETAAAQAE